MKLWTAIHYRTHIWIFCMGTSTCSWTSQSKKYDHDCLEGDRWFLFSWNCWEGVSAAHGGLVQWFLVCSSLLQEFQQSKYLAIRGALKSAEIKIFNLGEYCRTIELHCSFKVCIFSILVNFPIVYFFRETCNNAPLYTACILSLIILSSLHTGSTSL